MGYYNSIYFINNYIFNSNYPFSYYTNTEKYFFYLYKKRFDEKSKKSINILISYRKINENLKINISIF